MGVLTLRLSSASAHPSFPAAVSLPEHYPIVDADGNVISEVTSGGPSPSTGQNVAMAYLPTALAAKGSKVNIQVRYVAVCVCVRACGRGIGNIEGERSFRVVVRFDIRCANPFCEQAPRCGGHGDGPAVHAGQVLPCPEEGKEVKHRGRLAPAP